MKVEIEIASDPINKLLGNASNRTLIAELKKRLPDAKIVLTTCKLLGRGVMATVSKMSGHVAVTFTTCYGFENFTIMTIDYRFV